MPLDPNALAAAFVATPFIDDAPIFGDGRGFIPLTQGAYFVKFVAVAGFTYTVGENEIPGNLVVLGPNGQPISPGFTPITDQTVEFTPQTTGLYLIVIVPHPQTVVAGQEVAVLITAGELGLTDPTIGGGLNFGPTFDPFNSLAGQVITGQLGGINPPPGTFQYVLHPPDGNANGLATAAPATTAPIPAPTSIGPAPPLTGNTMPLSPTPPPQSLALTPLETANGGKPITWVGSTDAPGMPGDPTQITIAPALSNYPTDANVEVEFSHPLTQQDFSLLIAAAHIWEVAANVHFNFSQDAPVGTPNTQQPDIRVGLGDIQSALDDPTMTFVGDTHFRWDANNKFMPDNLVTIEDPEENPVTSLKDGDFQYNGTTATMFQSMIHELGHALGLAHNPNDPNSIMNPLLSSKNALPDDNDVAAIQSLYGAPTKGPVFGSQAELDFLHGLVQGAGMVA